MKRVTRRNFTFEKKTAVAIGKFDACHRGHKALVSALVSAAKAGGLRSVVFSFNPSPSEFFGRSEGEGLFTRDEKKYIFREAPFREVDFFVEYPFDEAFANLSAGDFLSEFAIKKLNCAVLAAGAGFRFGRGARGEIGAFRAFLSENGAELIETPNETENGEVISSSAVRRAVSEGDFARALRLMGRPFFLRGSVSRGARRGAGLGFPTANVEIPEKKFMPKDGVYATGFEFSGKEYQSVTNVGGCPTFSETRRKTETFILNYSGELYGKTARVNFYRRIRGVKKFKNAAELAAQIRADAEFSRRVFAFGEKVLT